MLKAIVPPEDPIPAPAPISPVGCSSTFIFITFKFSSLPSTISYVASLKILLALICAIDLSIFRFVKGSPSSKISSPLITSSLVA